MTSCAHFLEFHRPGDLRAGQNAGRFLAGALREGGVAVAIAGARCAKGMIAELGRMGFDPVTAMQRERFVLFESAEMLSRFHSRHGISVEQFDRAVGAAMRKAAERANAAPLRVFGDMVGVLWQRERRDAAVELESLWNALQQELGFEMYCAYPVDVFGSEFSEDALDGVLEAHTHLSPSLRSAELGCAFDRALDEVLGDVSLHVRSASGSSVRPTWASMPKLEKMILWLRSNLPEHADMILNRARGYYEHTAPRVYLREEHATR